MFMHISTAQWLLGLLAIPANAAASLPLIIVLGLVAARRGNASFCLRGNLALMRFAALLSLLAPIYYFLNYLTQIWPLLAPGASLLGPLFTLAGCSHACSILASLTGSLFLFLAWRSLRKKALQPIPAGDRFRSAYVKGPILLCMAALAMFFAIFWLENWPFAGLPPGMEPERAFMAVGKNAMRHFFMTFCPAGALALPLALSLRAGTPAQRGIGVRWLAAWAVAGYLPHTLMTLGMLAGISAHGNLQGLMTADLWTQGARTVLTICAMACWLNLLLGRSRRKWLAWAGLCLLILRASVPYVMGLLA